MKDPSNGTRLKVEKHRNAQYQLAEVDGHVDTEKKTTGKEHISREGKRMSSRKRLATNRTQQVTASS